MKNRSRRLINILWIALGLLKYPLRFLIEGIVVAVIFVIIFLKVPLFADFLFDFIDKILPVQETSYKPEEPPGQTVEPDIPSISKVEHPPTRVPGIGPYKYGYCTRVLSIDGGGIRGIIPALVLAEIESQSGRPISELFDLIVGTSTGGILALGLTMPDQSSIVKPAYTAKQLVKFYELKGQIIFPSLGGSKNIRWIFRPKYSEEGIEQVLKDFFRDTLIGHALTFVIIPTYEIEDREHLFFNNYSVYGNFYMRDVARATSAAPTYFPPVKITVSTRVHSKGYLTLIDGGVFANNPAPYALHQAKIMSSSENILLVSIGTGSSTVPIQYEKSRQWGLLGWSSALLSIVFSDPGVGKEMESFLPENFYHRIQPELTKEHDKLDDATPLNVEQLKKIAQEMIVDKRSELSLIVRKLTLPPPPDCPPRITPDVER